VDVGEEVRYASARLEQTLKATEDVKIEASEHTLTVNDACPSLLKTS
jgi:hypothetical protein